MSSNPCKHISKRQNKTYISYDDDCIQINERNLDDMMKSIVTTTSKFVYPSVYTLFAKRELSLNSNIMFSNSDLDAFRIWSNQVRELYNEDNKDMCKYMCYEIGKSILCSLKKNGM